MCGGGRYLSRGRRGSPKAGEWVGVEEGEWDLGHSKYPLPGQITIWVPDSSPRPESYSVTRSGKGA